MGVLQRSAEDTDPPSIPWAEQEPGQPEALSLNLELPAAWLCIPACSTVAPWAVLSRVILGNMLREALLQHAHRILTLPGTAVPHFF